MRSCQSLWKGIRRNENAKFGVIIAGPVIVDPTLFVVESPGKRQRMACSSFNRKFAERFVFIFDGYVTILIHQRNSCPLVIS